MDSAVTAALLYKAIGSQLSCILVDNGLLRKDEQAAVIAEFSDHFKADLHVVQAEERFLKQLEGVTEPQRNAAESVICLSIASRKKRKDFRREVHSAGDAVSGRDRERCGGRWSCGNDQVASQCGRLPEQLGFELVEPLRDLFKDEVRKLGIELGLPEHLVWRHPFPVPAWQCDVWAKSPKRNSTCSAKLTRSW